MTQWAVVWRPDPTHVVRVLGPYRSARKADEVMAEMEALESELDIRSGFTEDPMSLLPQVVPFEDWRDVQRELRAHYAEDAGSSELPEAECWCSDSAQEYGLTDVGCPRHGSSGPEPER